MSNTSDDALDSAVVVQPPSRIKVNPDDLLDAAKVKDVLDGYVPMPASGVDGDREKIQIPVPDYMVRIIDNMIGSPGLPKTIFKNRATFGRFALVVAMQMVSSWSQAYEIDLGRIENDELRALLVLERAQGTYEMKARIGVQAVRQASMLMEEVEALVRLDEHHRAALHLEQWSDDARTLGASDYAVIMAKGLIQTDQNKRDMRKLVDSGMLSDPWLLTFLYEHGVIDEIPDDDS
jgi:hypothetical protein